MPFNGWAGKRSHALRPTSFRFANQLAGEDSMFVELDTRHGNGLTVTLEWDRATGQTQIVIRDARSDGRIAFGVPSGNAADAFRHPFRYAP